MSVDDDWANWKPVQDASAQGGSAFKARVALSSHGGSVSPDRRRPSAASSRNAFNNNNNRNNNARDDRSAISRNPGPSASPAKSADVVAMRNFSRGEQPRSPFNMRNGATNNNARDVVPPPPSAARPSSDTIPDRRARPRSPDLDRERDNARRSDSNRDRNRDDVRRAGTPPKSARETEREDRSSRNSRRDDRPRERSRSRDRGDRREKEKEKEQDRDRDTHRSKDDNSRRDRARDRDSDRRDSGRSDARRKDDNYRSSDRRSDRDSERKPREEASPRDRSSRREDDREDRRSSLKRARTPERQDTSVQNESGHDEPIAGGKDGGRRDRRNGGRISRWDKPDTRERKSDRNDAAEEDVRESKRVKGDTPPPRSAKSDLSQVSMQEPVDAKDIELRSNTPPPRIVEQIPEPIKPEVLPQVDDIPSAQEVVEPLPMDEPYLAEGYTLDSLKKKPKILIRNLAPGTSHSDIQYFCDDFGIVLAVSSTPDSENVESRIFEVSFNVMKEAESAVSSIDNMQADGQILKASIVRSGLRIKGADQTNKTSSTVNTPTSAVPKPSSTGSLLDRLSAPAPPPTVTAPIPAPNSKKAKTQANGSLPADVLSPYTEILEKAGIRSVTALKKVLRPTSIPAYVDMLSDKYPNEELLSGLTAKWALRERLEELLGEKKESRIDWGDRPRS